MSEDHTLRLIATFEDGALVIERQDGQPISIITHEDYDHECIEVLEKGCTGNAVHALQALLNCHGQHLEMDGIFGELTQQALMIVQDQSSLPVTGMCDRESWEKLIGR